MPKRETIKVAPDCIRNILKGKGIKSSYFCIELMKKYRTWISEWDRGNNMPSPEEAARMCAILNTDPEEFIVGDDDIQKVRALIDAERARQNEKLATIADDELSDVERIILEGYHNAPENIRLAVDTLLGIQEHDK